MSGVRVLIEKEGYTGYILQLFGILHPILCPGSGLAIHLRLVGATEAHDSPVNPVGTAVGIRRRSFAGATTAIIGAGWTRAGKRRARLAFKMRATASSASYMPRSKWSSCSATCGTGGRRHRFREMIKAQLLSLRLQGPRTFAMEVTRPVNSGLAGKPHRDLIQKYRTLYDRTRSLEEGQMKAPLQHFHARTCVGVAKSLRRRRRAQLQKSALRRSAEALSQEIGLAFLAGFLALSAVGTFVQRLRRPAIQVGNTPTTEKHQCWNFTSPRDSVDAHPWPTAFRSRWSTPSRCAGVERRAASFF